MNIFKLIEPLWRVGLIPDKWFRCPLCGNKVMEYGYPEMCVHHYKCSNKKCDWR